MKLMLKNKHMRTIQWILFLLMLPAILGPWIYEAIPVPSPHPCTTGFRVDEYFCGILVSGLQVFALFFANIFTSALYLVTGDASLREFLGSLMISLFFLPVISLLFQIVSQDRIKNWGKGVHIGALSMTILLGLLGVVFGSMFGNVKELWRFWGFWLYEWVVMSALVLELFRMILVRKTRMLKKFNPKEATHKYL
jgi:hypothetical protein